MEVVNTYLLSLCSFFSLRKDSPNDSFLEKSLEEPLFSYSTFHLLLYWGKIHWLTSCMLVHGVTLPQNLVVKRHTLTRLWASLLGEDLVTQTVHNLFHFLLLQKLNREVDQDLYEQCVNVFKVTSAINLTKR